MDLLVLGPTGRVGRLVVEEALAGGHTVRAATRSDPEPGDRPGLATVRVDLGDPESLAAAVRGVDAVLGCLGPRTNTADEVTAFESNSRSLVQAMSQEGVRRLVVLSGAGVIAPGERRGRLDSILAAIVRRAARHTVAAKQAEFEVVSASDLEWTALRPGFVVDGPRTGRYVMSDASPPIGARITRADIAVAIVEQVAARDRVREAPFLWTAKD